MRPAFVKFFAGVIMAASPDNPPDVNHWRLWLEHQGGTLLDTPEKAVDFAETVVRVRYGQAEVDEERPFLAVDAGDRWQVKGSNGGTHALPVMRWVSVVILHKATGNIIDLWHQMSEADRAEFDRATATPRSMGQEEQQ